MPIISQTAEYALRAVVHLANAAQQQGLASQNLAEIATGTKVPAGYLSKVLQQLARADLLVSQRGIGGGFRLARAAEEITIYDVVNAVDEVPRIRTCPLGIAEHMHLCPLHRRLDAAMEHVEHAFQSTTIAELVTRKTSLCKVKSEADQALTI